MKTNQLLLPGLLAICISTGSASAAVVVNSHFATGTNASNATVLTFDSTTLGGFTTTSADKLLVAFAGRRDNNDFTITYDGIGLTAIQSVAGTQNNGAASIFYLDNPSTDSSASLVITANSSDFIQYRLDAIKISGLAAGGASVSVTDSDSSTVVSQSLLGTAGGFMLGSIGSNGNPSISASPTPTYLSDDTRSQNAYWLDTDLATTYSYDTTNTNAVGVLASFAIPEPSTALLGGLGFLALLRRRR